MDLKDGHAAGGTGLRSTFQQDLQSKADHVIGGGGGMDGWITATQFLLGRIRVGVWQILQVSRTRATAPSGLVFLFLPMMSSFLMGWEPEQTGTGADSGSEQARVEATPTWKGAVLLGRSTLAMSQLSEALWDVHSR